MITVYWIFMIICVLMDVTVGISWVPKLKGLQDKFDGFLMDEISEKYKNEDFCRLFNKIQRNFQCCGGDTFRNWHKFDSFCNESLYFNNSTSFNLPKSCCDKEFEFCIHSTYDEQKFIDCEGALLFWFHSKVDLLSLLGVCFVFLFRLIGLLILRTEIRAFVEEIEHTNSVRRDYCGLEFNDNELYANENGLASPTLSTKAQTISRCRRSSESLFLF